MKQILRALKATYDFFAGDAIIIAFVAAAFCAAGLLARFAHAPMAALAAALVGLVTLGLVLTLGREARGRGR